MHIESQIVHAHLPQALQEGMGAIVPPLYLSTTFERNADGTYPQGYVYSRSGNPNRQALEDAIAMLEHGTEAAGFASGSAATLAVLQALKTGDHVIAPQNVYFGIQEMLRKIFAQRGLAFSLVDTTDVTAVRQAVQTNTRLILIETPSNPQLAVTDIQSVADIAHEAGAYLACDNTLASPVLQNPLKHGADLVIHATTKYLAGHSDVIGGMVVTREMSPLFEQIRLIQEIGGAVPSPFDCWLTLRGLQTLTYRVRAQAANAQTLAHFLNQHPAVEQVLYPGLESHSGYAIATKQMSGYGGLLSILVKGTQETAMAVAAKVNLFTRATSFGGPHSLIEHRASIEAPGTQTPPNLLRLSIGLEHTEDLIADLDQALSSFA
ncbi:MAG TPA: aminotransferase class I/II-fold pyridoxal phosphate-dependent enzyme [Trichocoleus sp.]